MKILNKLTNKHLLMNKKRTIVTIIGIMLSTALMCGIGLLISSFRDYSIRETISYNGDYFAVLNNVPYKNLETIQKEENVSSYYLKHLDGYFILQEEENNDLVYRIYASVVNADKTYLETLKLKEGSYPKKKNELILTEKTAAYLDVKVGDKVSTQLGSIFVGEEKVEESSYIPYDATFEVEKNVDYEIVGIIEKNQVSDEDWYENGFAFTSFYGQDDITNIYIKTKSAKDIFNVSEALKTSLEKENSEASIRLGYNDSLLALYGASKYGNIMNSMVGLVAIILSLISIGCTIVIYNSFAISVMERKKQFGLFASIGATKGQLRYTVFYEAFMVGMIGIVLGILASFIGIGIVLLIMNHLLIDIFQEGLYLTVYPIFLILPICFMVLVILFSAYAPAHRASRVSPITAIRGNDDIKINKRKIKISKLSKKLFGIEGEIALKNIKRNKKKYRITIISLVTSIVLFISFSSLLSKIINIDSYVMGIDYDIYFQYSENKTNTIEREDAMYQLNQIIKNDEIEEYSIRYDTWMHYTDKKYKYTDQYQTVIDEQYGTEEDIESDYQKFYHTYQSIVFIELDDNTYENLKKKNNIKKDVPLLVNYYETIFYSSNSRRLLSGKIYQDKIREISLCDTSDVIQNNDYDYYHFDTVECGKTRLELTMITELPIGFSYVNDSMTIFVNKELYQKIYQELYPNETDIIQGISHYQRDDFSNHYDLFLKVDGYESLDEIFSKLEENDPFNEYYYENVLKSMKQVNNLVLVIKILFYGFIALVTLIGVTSVFNTLNTSIGLRKKEFSMLRSMGLTPRGLNKMIVFESVFFGIKSLVIGIPISLIFVYLISKTTSDFSSTGFVIPVSSILIAVFAVFVIVLLTMIYATSKIRHDNILDAIREENI